VELEPLLGVAVDLAHVREVFPAPTFSDELEARLLARAQRQATANAIAADDAADNAPTVSLVALPDRPSRRRLRPARDSRRGSWRIWSALAAAVLLAPTITTFAVAAYASPGSANYTVRRWQENARTNLANNDAERAQLHIQYATGALDALESAIAQHASAGAYTEALDRFTDELHQAATGRAQVPEGTDHDTRSADLDTLRTRGRSDLRSALPSLSWSSRIATTSALGALGVTVMSVSGVSGVRSGLYGAHMWTLTITGSGFQCGAIVLVNGRPAGHVVSLTSTVLVAQLASGEDDFLPHEIGVGNPDDTAAATAEVTSRHDDGPRPTGAPGDAHTSGGCIREHASATCTPTRTPTLQH
jgi:hypothetical protein